LIWILTRQETARVEDQRSLLALLGCMRSKISFSEIAEKLDGQRDRDVAWIDAKSPSHSMSAKPCSRQPRIMLGKIREHWPTYHYKSDSMDGSAI
jgi:hypothetical protein